MIGILTAVLGTVAKGAASKAIGGAVAGAALNGAGPLLDVFSKGLVAGAGTSIEELGYAIGNLVIGGAVGYIVTWLAPANAKKPA